MSDLETELRRAARSGRLNHISVGFIGGKWSAGYRGVDNHDGRIVEDDDIVVAMLGALKGGKVPPRPKIDRKALIARKKDDDFGGML